ncbi:DUF6993 domain-containing protein [Salinibacterium hongtaonis]|uniref:DUF6993 domain-containing protein n=1 Tax=Homoserinimonas hongtaonis TaxID=2079791 RepID=A0A2U1SZC0_9MICO|nr:hypothetical protein [Salinibacterium hongtaonis]PWB96975.1 hypothetical protein DF220_03325 [Salinibacterium hongtaonis]
MTPSDRSAVAVATIATALALTLVGCTAPVEKPASSSTPGVPSESTEIPAKKPEFLPGGGAGENRDYFDYVLGKHFVEGGATDGVSVVAVLVQAGWTKDQLEITADTTPLGNATDAITVAVRLPDGCLIGQWGGEYSSSLMPVLATGTCLVGATRPIDW